MWNLRDKILPRTLSTRHCLRISISSLNSQVRKWPRYFTEPTCLTWSPLRYTLGRWAPFSILEMKYKEALFFWLKIISLHSPNISHILNSLERPETDGARITKSIINKFMCNSTELDSHIQYIQAYKIQGNTNATLRDTQRDTYKEDLFH